jgi:hypothetical protein
MAISLEGVSHSNVAFQSTDFRRAVLRRLQDALPVEEPDRVVIVVDVPDRAEVRKVQDGVLGEIGHVMNDAVRLVAVVPGYGGDAAVLYAAPHLHFAGNHIVFTGSQMFVPGNAGPLRAIQKHCPMACLLGRSKEL